MEQVLSPKIRPPYSGVEVWNERSFEKACQRSHFYRVEFSPGLPRLVHPMMCKSRKCEQCGFFWAWKTRLALANKRDELIRNGLPPMSRAVTLTTSYDCGYKKVWMALKYFWRYLRRYSPDFTRPWGNGRKKLRPGRDKARFPYANLQYWGTVEENQEHTQPHMHFIIYNPDNDEKSYIPKELINRAWIEAQKAAKFTKIAWSTRIEKIRTDVTHYFTKYLTKLTGGKDEIPGENWQGRYVRYSRTSKLRKGFFQVSIAAMTAAHGLAKYFSDPDDNRSYCLINQDTTLEEFIEIVQNEAKELNEIINRAWDWQSDRARAEIYKDEMFPTLPTELPPKSVLLRTQAIPSKLGPPIPPGYYAGGAAPGTCETIPLED